MAEVGTQSPTCGSAKGAAARHQSAKELLSPLVGAPSAQPVGGVVRDPMSPATVLREFLKSAKGAAARHQTMEELANPLGGALDTATVLREFLRRSSLSYYAFSPAVRRNTLESSSQVPLPSRLI